MRGVTHYTTDVFVDGVISTHTPHARRDTFKASEQQFGEISTHTPHARRDYNTVTFALSLNISTHTPHARRDSPLHV